MHQFGIDSGLCIRKLLVISDKPLQVTGIIWHTGIPKTIAPKSTVCYTTIKQGGFSRTESKGTDVETFGGMSPRRKNFVCHTLPRQDRKRRS